MTQKLKFIFPFLLLFFLFLLLWRALFYATPNELPSALIGEPIPTFSLPLLTNSQQYLTDKNINGQIALINIWASWCYACQLELPMLMRIKNQYHIPIYGINYKDDQQKAIRWLNKFGNPYTAIAIDKSGDTAIDFGVYGTPETYVVSPNGKIIYRHVGALDQQSWDNVLYPMIKKFAYQP